MSNNNAFYKNKTFYKFSFVTLTNQKIVNRTLIVNKCYYLSLFSWFLSPVIFLSFLINVYKKKQSRFENEVSGRCDCIEWWLKQQCISRHVWNSAHILGSWVHCMYRTAAIAVVVCLDQQDIANPSSGCF